MKYVAKDMGDAAEVNAGRGNRWRELIKLLSLAFALIVSLYVVTVYLAEYVISGISVERERQWFDKVDFLTDEPKSSSSDEFARAEKLLKQLVENPEVPELNYKLVVLDSKELNAFAFPGGTIGLTSELLLQLKSDSALAFVIGHELGHFKYRHHLKGFSRAFSLSVIFSIVFGGDSDLVVTQHIVSLLDARHSQQQEKDSDAFGAAVVMQTFGGAENIDELFHLLQDKEHSPIDFLASHPSSQSRIDHLNAIILAFNEKRDKPYAKD